MLFSAKGNVVRLYGNIYEGDGIWISRHLDEIDGKFPEIEIHLHGNGGSVFDGNLIFTTLRKMKSERDIYLDGLCASMYTILMLGGRKIFMAKNAMIMTHAPKGMIRGTAADFLKGAKLLNSLEDIFVDNYKTKTKKDEAVVREWLVGDNYFNSKESKEAGLVDEIVDDVLDTSKLDAIREMKVAALLDADDEHFAFPEGSADPDNPNELIKPKNDPMKKELIEALQLQGVSEESSDTAVIAAVQDAINNQSSKTELEKKAKEALQGKLNALGQASITAEIDTAVADGRITAEAKASFEKIGADSGLETLRTVLTGLPKRQGIVASIVPSSNSSASAQGKTWDGMQKNEAPLLEAMMSADHPQHEQFKAMFKARYGTDYIDN